MRRVLSTGQLLLVLTAAPWWLAACGTGTTPRGPVPDAFVLPDQSPPHVPDARIGFDTTPLIPDAPPVFDAFFPDQSPPHSDAYVPDTTTPPTDAPRAPVDTTPPPDAPPPDAGVPADAE